MILDIDTGTDYAYAIHRLQKDLRSAFIICQDLDLWRKVADGNTKMWDSMVYGGYMVNIWLIYG